MTGFTSGMKSSLKDDWATPIQLFNQLDKEFRFTLDVCADENNHKCERYFDIHTDGLSQDWGSEVCWMNPPYGRVIGKWMKKARDAARGGAIVVCLIPARTDTKWWRETVMHASEVRFIEGRVKFGDGKTGAPFPSAIVIFGTPTTPRMRMMMQEASE